MKDLAVLRKEIWCGLAPVIAAAERSSKTRYAAEVTTAVVDVPYWLNAAGDLVGRDRRLEVSKPEHLNEIVSRARKAWTITSIRIVKLHEAETVVAEMKR